MMSRFWTKWKKQLLGTLLVVVCGILLFFILQHLGLLKSGTRKILNILSPLSTAALSPICWTRCATGLRTAALAAGPHQASEKETGLHRLDGLHPDLLVLLIAIIGFLMAMVLPQLATSVTRLVNAIPGYAADIYAALLPLVERFG